MKNKFLMCYKNLTILLIVSFITMFLASYGTKTWEAFQVGIIIYVLSIVITCLMYKFKFGKLMPLNNIISGIAIGLLMCPIVIHFNFRNTYGNTTFILIGLLSLLLVLVMYFLFYRMIKLRVFKYNIFLMTVITILVLLASLIPLFLYNDNIVFNSIFGIYLVISMHFFLPLILKVEDENKLKLNISMFTHVAALIVIIITVTILAEDGSGIELIAEVLSGGRGKHKVTFEV